MCHIKLGSVCHSAKGSPGEKRMALVFDYLLDFGGIEELDGFNAVFQCLEQLPVIGRHGKLNDEAGHPGGVADTKHLRIRESLLLNFTLPKQPAANAKRLRPILALSTGQKHRFLCFVIRGTEDLRSRDDQHSEPFVARLFSEKEMLEGFVVIAQIQRLEVARFRQGQRESKKGVCVLLSGDKSAFGNENPSLWG